MSQPDPIEQAEMDEATMSRHQEQMAKLSTKNRADLRRIEAMELIRRAASDWRKDPEIAAIQGEAVARELAGRDDLYIDLVNEFESDQFIKKCGKVAGDAILAANLKAVAKIQEALKELQKWRLTDEEVEELLAPGVPRSLPDAIRHARGGDPPMPFTGFA